MREYLQNIEIQHLPHFSINHVDTDLLRLDLIHPVVSGNKWFKLQYYLQDALVSGKRIIASFGGAYSNHIVALAYAAKEIGFESIGYIRGEKSTKLTPTLLQAKEYGMQLVFVDRIRYRDKDALIQEQSRQDLYWVMEGGYGVPGAKGAADILTVTDTSRYNYILCAAGTGTMMAGLIKAARPDQHIMGISVLKNNFGLENEVRVLLTAAEKQKTFSILHDYHFGGYAKHPGELTRFMYELWLSEKVPTDIVYTSKLLFAVKDMILHKLLPPGSRLLVIHSGGLQGNNSLPPGTLPF